MKKWVSRLKKDERGLTLVELLAVVVILAIVAAIAFVLIGNVLENSKKDAHVSNAKQLIASAKLYEANGESIPAAGVSSADLQTADLVGLLTDPWKKTATGYSGTVTKSNGVYSVTFNALDSKCDITATEAQLTQDGRDACGKTYSGGGGGS